ncbi:MAG: radical SAM protein [Oscillospiraceae bacterium]
MRYEGSVYRPPSEAHSLIIQVTLGCSHNACTFCPMYKDKRFRVRPFEEVLEDLKEARLQYSHIDRIFFADGDALCLETSKLLSLLGAVRATIPECSRIGTYTRASHILRKTDEELLSLREAGLGIVYIGAESGSAEVLRRVNKGETPEQLIEAVHRSENAGIPASVTFISGLGGKELMREHAVKTGEMIGKMGASYVGLLTLMLAPNTPIFDELENGSFVPLNSREVAEELDLILSNASCEKPCVLRSNHASNSLILHGTLPQDKDRLLRQVRQAAGAK